MQRSGALRVANDSDPDGETLAVDAYDFVTTDVFSYRIVDSRGLVTAGKVTLQVQ